MWDNPRWVSNVRQQLALPFGPLRNSNLFSNHWLENRLPLEPESKELSEKSGAALDRLAEIWAEQRGRVELYGDEQGLEQAFIHPVLQALGWKFKYQTFLRGGKPDYGLFLDEDSLDAELKAGQTTVELARN